MNDRLGDSGAPLAPRQDDAEGSLDALDAGPKPMAAVFRPRGQRGRRAKGEGESVDRSVAQARRKGSDVPTPPALAQAPEEELDLSFEAFASAESVELDPPALAAPEPSLVGDPGEVFGDVTTPRPAPAILPPGADPVWAHRALLEAVDRQAQVNRGPTEGAWYAELFGREYLLGYPDRRPFARDAERDFVEASLGVSLGGRILDLACGYGRMAVPLGRKGYEIIGIDLNLDLLERGLGFVHREKLPVKLVHGDMRDLKFDQVFDGACLLDTSLGFFTEVEDLAVLRGVFQALKRGGRLILDLANRDHLLDEVPLRNWWEGDGCLLQEDVELDAHTSRLRIRRYLVFGDGRERIHDIDLRLYALHEILAMLRLVGFAVDEISGSIHSKGAFFGARSPRLLVRAVRPG